jgi:uncharacterized membrane protein
MTAGLEWLTLLIRWMHVFTAILWVGCSWYFGWIELRMREATLRSKETGEPAALWLAHGGGFYKLERFATPGLPFERVHLFRFHALVTWVNGVLLLALVYWTSGALVDPDVSRLTDGQAIMLVLGVLAAGWLIYDVLFLGPLARKEPLAMAVGYALVVALAWLLLHLLSARAAYIHLGAVFGTLMVGNVWMRILPAQRKMARLPAEAAAERQALSDRARTRARHNTYLVVPTVFTMLANHFPTATYGGEHAFAVLALAVALGWGAANRLRGIA